VAVLARVFVAVRPESSVQAGNMPIEYERVNIHTPRVTFVFYLRAEGRGVIFFYI
jgi:hypothetical protein